MIARSLHTRQKVFIKVIRNVGTDPDDEELRILRFLNDEPHRSNQDNPCVPVLAEIPLPQVTAPLKNGTIDATTYTLVVMPRLFAAEEVEKRLGCFGYQLQLLRQALKVSQIPRNGY